MTSVLPNTAPPPQLTHATDTLLPQHQALIKGSAIAPEVAAQRGYRSVTDPDELRALGFAHYQCKVPGMLVPIWDVFGQNGASQFRPDSPRKDARGRDVKYETPQGSHLVLDVPLSVRPHLSNPAVALYITEGSRKVDSAVSQGLCCIGVPGVWGWRGKNQDGGKTVLPDWESIALNGRNVVLAFDSDAMCKASVHEALQRLSAFLRRRGARVRYLCLPEGSGDA